MPIVHQKFKTKIVPNENVADLSASLNTENGVVLLSIGNNNCLLQGEELGNLIAWLKEEGFKLPR